MMLFSKSDNAIEATVSFAHKLGAKITRTTIAHRARLAKRKHCFVFEKWHGVLLLAQATDKTGEELETLMNLQIE
jgi:hypothetical protein